MIFKQKSGNLKTVFDFQPEKLNYHLKEDMQTRITSISYESIQLSNPVKQYKKQSLGVTLAMFVYGLCVIVGVAARGEGSSHIVMMVTVTVGVALLLLHQYKSSKCGHTCFETEKGSLFILHDKQYDVIFAELEKHFRSRMYAMYGELDLNNSYDEEIARFKMLKENKVIGDEEYQAIFNKIKDRIRSRNMGIDMNIPPEMEVRKYEWMLDNAIISPDEFRQSIEKLKSLSSIDYDIGGYLSSTDKMQ